MNAYVFFADARWRHSRPYDRLLGWLVRTLDRSPYAHCALGFNQAVIDPAIAGNRFWPLDPFVVSFPTLALVVRVPLVYPLNLDYFVPDQPKRVWPTIARWLTRGSVHTEDCACVVRDCLIAGGVDVPDWIVSPRQIANWLINHGYEYVQINEPGRAGRRAALEFCRPD